MRDRCFDNEARNIVRDYRKRTTGSPDLSPKRLAIGLIAKERGISIAEAEIVVEETYKKAEAANKLAAEVAPPKDDAIFPDEEDKKVIRQLWGVVDALDRWFESEVGTEILVEGPPTNGSALRRYIWKLIKER